MTDGQIPWHTAENPMEFQRGTLEVLPLRQVNSVMAKRCPHHDGHATSCSPGSLVPVKHIVRSWNHLSGVTCVLPTRNTLGLYRAVNSTSSAYRKKDPTLMPLFVGRLFIVLSHSRLPLAQWIFPWDRRRLSTLQFV